MSKFILIFSVVFFAFQANGQENRLSFGSAFSIDKYNFNFKPFDGIEQTQKTDLAYSFGLRLQYDIHDKMSLRSGVMYSGRTYKTMYAFSPISSGDPSIPRSSSLNLSYLSIPLMIGFNVLKNEKFTLMPSAGFVSEFLLARTETSIFEDNSNSASDFLSRNLASILYSTQVNVGVEYHFSRKVYLTFEPYLRYGLNTWDDEIMNSNPVSYGALLSINYRCLK